MSALPDRKFLWQPDPFKAKDFDASTLLQAVKAVPSKYSLRRLILNILNQESLGSCVANAIAQAVRAAHVQMGVPIPLLLSRLFSYYFARATHGDTQLDKGTWLRACFDAIRILGFCPEAFWPYDITKFNQFPSALAARAAADQATAVGYYRITSTGDQRIRDIQAAIAANHCVVFGTQVSNKFAEFGEGSAPLDTPTSSETILGGHALTLAEYETLPSGTVVFHGPNSWGRLVRNAGQLPGQSDVERLLDR
jgi:hypothetical protein